MKWPCRLLFRLVNLTCKRVLPAGWDREGNTYWLFDDNRLWVQRAPPKRPRRNQPLSCQPSSTSKAKRRKTNSRPPPRPAGRRSLRLNPHSGADQSDVFASEAPTRNREEGLFSSDSDLSPPADPEKPWTEFETICVTRSEWENFAQRFAHSKHPDERNLHVYISKEVLPPILDMIHAEEKKAALEAALSKRKRSSRIALRDSEREQREREEAELRALKERAAAALKAERDHQAREEAELQARKSRENRLRERGERLLARERMINERQKRAQERSRDPWHLRCDICLMDELNPIDSRPVVACEKCGVWQHMSCWDEHDRSHLRSPRRWENVSFCCQHCKASPMLSAHAMPAALDQTRGAGTHTSTSEPQVPTTPPITQTSVLHESRVMSQASPSSASLVRPASPARVPHLSPRGSFPLRTHLTKSPLSRAVEPEDVPTPLSLHCANPNLPLQGHPVSPVSKDQEPAPQTRLS